MSAENWEAYMKMQHESLLKEMRKLYRSLKRQHCDGCDKNYECPTCKPEFDRIRTYIDKLREMLNLDEKKK